MRAAGRLRMAFYPLPLSEAQRIRRFLLFPNEPVSVLDPCVGDGVAFEAITSGGQVLRYGIELDACRAEQARVRVASVLQGNALEAHCAADTFGALYCNPPYDHEIGPGDNRRMEEVFLRHTYRWLKPGGVLVLVIPGERISDCSQVLATQFLNLRAYSLSEPECVRYKQVVVLAVRRSRRERERLQDSDITLARLRYASLARNPAQLPVLPVEPDARYNVPLSGPALLVNRGLPLDEIENLLPRSTAYRQARQILFAEPSAVYGRPLTPLHSGHLALLAVSGMLDGIFGSGEDRHIASWQSVKVTSCSTEEEDNGTIIQREREYFTNELTLVYANGKAEILK
jgi:SAM-dependent methyltransferase